MPSGMLYRWEDNNHGLEHKCGTCATVLSNPRAKKTCLGIHEEVCTRYHKTLFFKGQSHHCDACGKTTEQHIKRHTEIAIIVTQVARIDAEYTSLLAYRTKKAPKAISRNTQLEEYSEPAEDNAYDWLEGEWTDGGIDLPLPTNDLDLPKAQQEAQLHSPDDRKAIKAQRKMARNKTRFLDISRDDWKTVEEALHPGAPTLLDTNAVQAGQGLENNATIDSNINFNSRTFRWGNLRQTVHEKRLTKNNNLKGISGISPAEVEDLLCNLLKSFGINVNLPCASKERRTLEKKLRKYVKADLEAFDNEQRETMQRMAGYWRYVNKRTYNAMVRENTIWNWATGEKLPEIEENSETSDTQEDEIIFNDETAPSSVSSSSSVPEDWDGDGEPGLSPERAPIGPLESLERSVNIGARSSTKFEMRDHESDNSPQDKSSRCEGPPSGLTLRYHVSIPCSTDDWAEKQELSSAWGSGFGRIETKLCSSVSKADKPAIDVFRSSKDDRLFNKPVHLASPPKENRPRTTAPSLCSNSMDLPLRPRSDKRIIDHCNAYSALEHEVPAPNEDTGGAEHTRTPPRTPVWPRKSRAEAFPPLPTLTTGENTAKGDQKSPSIKVLNITAGAPIRPTPLGVGKKFTGGLRKAGARNQVTKMKSSGGTRSSIATNSDGWMIIAKNR